MLIEDCEERCDSPAMVAPTHSTNDGREERVARYKEERRRQLAAQFGSRDCSSLVRSTRASRLRSQANIETAARCSRPEQSKQEEEHLSIKEQMGNVKKHKDKSKWKSSIKRSLTEPLPQPTQGERQKFRTCLGSMVSPNTTCRSVQKPTKDANSPSPVPRSAQLVKRQAACNTTSPKRSDRGSVTPDSDGSPKLSRIPKKVNNSQTSKSGPNPKLQQKQKGNVKSAGSSGEQSSSPRSPSARQHPSILKKTSVDEPYQPVSILKRRTSQDEGVNLVPLDVEESSPPTPTAQPSSILKKKTSQEEDCGFLCKSVNVACSNENVKSGMVIVESNVEENPPQQQTPILKRKTSQEEGRVKIGSPVTFASNVVVEKKGILKKHKSLDETRSSLENLRIQNGSEEYRPTGQGVVRRCSLEEFMRNQTEPQGILKRKTSRDELPDQVCVIEPQSILKRKHQPSWISEAESVIQLAAESLHDLDHVRPILKRKEEPTSEEVHYGEITPRPILKKKSSSEEEEHHVRSILKINKKSEESSCSSSGQDSPLRRISDPRSNNGSSSSSPIKLRSRPVVNRRMSSDRRSLDPELVFRRPESPTMENTRPRPLSVAERVYNLESFLALEGELSAFLSKRNMSSTMDGVSEEGSELQRRGSVSERVSMWPKVEPKEKTVAQQRQAKVNRPRSKDSRFNTQPVTQDEVEMAKMNNNYIPLDCVDEEDPSRLSVTERVKLFSGVKTAPPIVRAATASAVSSALPPRPRTHSSSIVGGLMKNLMQKSTGAIVKLKEKQDSFEKIEASGVKKRVSIVSSSSSEEESSGSSSSEESEEVRRIIQRKGDEDEASSSGGREVVTIFKNANRGGVERMLRYGEVSAIRRCATQPIPSHHNHHEEVEDGSPPTTIAERLAALQKRGQSDWKKRVAKPNPEEDLLPQGRVLAERVGRLETASQGWKARVTPGDAKQFTVAARMSPSPTPTPSLGVTSRTPAPVVFQPVLPQPPPTQLLRSVSAPGKEIKDLNLIGSDEVQGPLISVPEICGAEVSAFFSKPLDKLDCSEYPDFDLEVLSSNTSQLLVQKKKIKVRRKHLSVNPLKALAQRSDLCTEYIEVRSGIAERDRRRINLDKLSKSSGLAVEALAGLASKEDIKAISLRKAGESPPPSAVSQWPHPLLLRVKGRRHPVTTVVKPHYSSVNQGDTFILITQNNVFLWIGEYSNVIEKSRGGEIALEVQSRRDLGCTGASQVVTLGGTEYSEKHSQFWDMLGLPSQMVHTYSGESAGHPDEDEVYEAAIAETYTVYSLTDGLLCPVQSYWGRLPKIDILDPMKVLVFDFVSEVYVWGGKTTALFDKKLAFQLAKELFKTRHFKWHPTGIAWLDSDLETEARSPWSVLCKITQHMEPVLFREKFVDWPSADISSISYIDRQVEAGLIVHPCNTDEMLNWSPTPPDLVLEGTNIGRGKTFFDTETRRHFEVITLGLKIWRVEDYTTVEVEEASVGQFNDKESYILRWEYRVTVSGRELNGEISKHGKQVGRERVTRWVWQGREAEALEQGAAALLATEEVAGVTVVRSGAEPPALLAALPGPLVVHWSTPQSSSSLLFIITGDVESEAVLRQVEPTWPSLRSKASAFFISRTSNRAYLWHGNKAQPNTKKVAITAVNHLRDTQPPELGLGLGVMLNFEQIEEGEEPHDFLEGVSDRESYGSLLQKENYENWSPRMFHLSSLLGDFEATPFVSTSFHPDYDTPFPYTQDDLYSTNRPGLVLVDGGSELWLWQGWSSEVEGTMGVRYQAERRAAMTTALQYWHRRSRPSHSVFLVWAGLEPPAFKALFPTWRHNEDAAQANLSEGRKPNEMKGVQEELASLNKCTYPPSTLMQHPLPAGVDPTRLELYLDPLHFKELLGVSPEEFNSLPFWKTEKLKKKAGLF